MRMAAYFSWASADILQEAETRVVSLDGDDEESVDMLLLYLYTLESPICFCPRKGYFVHAERAYLIGDKYQLTALKAAGSNYMLASIRKNLRSPRKEIPKARMAGWCGFFERLWKETFPDSDTMRKVLLENLVTISNLFMKEKQFQELLTENRVFAAEFTAALVKALCKT